MEIRPIKTEHDYDAALAEVEALWGAEPDTPEGDKLDVLITLVEAYLDKEHQRRGLGQALLKDALLRTAQAADIAGIRCLLVHAKDDAARRWYESWEFEPSPTDPYHLFLMLKDLKSLLN